jgi:hypothetical protein
VLTLITGLPGNGKTLYALQYVQAWALREGRQVYSHGISGLSPTLGWKECPTSRESLNGKSVDDPKSENVEVPNWWLLPAKSIFLIDEAQNCGFGPRMRGVSPIWSSKLETHRHMGIDGVFITQDPGLLDAHDRKLCELHFHVMRIFGMAAATVHEFRPVRTNIQQRKGSIAKKWLFPKEVYSWYTSAEAHTHKARIPSKVFAMAGLVVALPLLGYWLWATKLDPHRDRGPASAAAAASAPIGVVGGVRRGDKLTTAEWVDQQQPRIAGLTYSAPVFDDVTKPVVAPYPAACVKMGERCGCYSQQATRLEVPRVMCEGIVAGGFFIAWDQPLARAVPVVHAPQAVQPGATYAGSLSSRVVPVSPVAEAVEVSTGRGKALPRAL